MTRGRAPADNKNASVGVKTPLSARSLADIVQVLPSLNKQELRALQAAIDKELTKNSIIEIELYHLVFEVVGERPLSLSKFEVSNNGILWRQNIPVFYDLVQKLMGAETPKKPLLQAVHKFLIELLIQDIKDRHMPLTLKAVCQELGNIKYAFDRAFPDYLENGLGHLIMAKLGGMK